MQTITTKYAGPTNTRGSRVVAKSWLKNKTTGWDHCKDSEANHKQAAQNLVDCLNSDRDAKGYDDYHWQIIAAGSLPDNTGNAYIIDLIKTF